MTDSGTGSGTNWNDVMSSTDTSISYDTISSDTLLSWNIDSNCSLNLPEGSIVRMKNGLFLELKSDKDGHYYEVVKRKPKEVSWEEHFSD